MAPATAASPAAITPPVTPAPPAAPPSPVRFPLDWLLAHASPAIQYRALTEVVRLTPAETEKVSSLPFAHKPALMLALQQAPDGTWDGGM